MVAVTASEAGGGGVGDCGSGAPRAVARNVHFVPRALGSHGRVQSKRGTASDSSCLLEGGFKGGEAGAQTRGRLGTKEQGGAWIGDRAWGGGREHCFRSDFGGQMEHSWGRLPGWRWGRKLGEQGGPEGYGGWWRVEEPEVLV